MDRATQNYLIACVIWFLLYICLLPFPLFSRLVIYLTLVALWWTYLYFRNQQAFPQQGMKLNRHRPTKQFRASPSPSPSVNYSPPQLSEPPKPPVANEQQQPKGDMLLFVPAFTAGSGWQKAQRKLLSMLNGDTATAVRLLEMAKRQNPGRTYKWYIEKVLWDLERDRGR